MSPRRFLLIALAAVTVVDCHRGRPGSESRPTGYEFREPYVGFVRDIRGSMVIVDEDTQTSTPRRGEIFVTENTEIVTRSGMLLPPSDLRRGMRLTVWFRGRVNATSSVVSASAARVLVEY